MAYNNNNRRGSNNFKPRRNFDNKDQSKRGLYVEVRGGDVMKALRIFKKKVQEEGILQEYKERQHYEKPSAKRKRQKDAAIKRTQREENKKIYSGEAPLQEVSGFAFMKSKRKRRKYSDKKSAVDRHLRSSGLR